MQTSFVPHCLIQENYIIAHELLHTVRNKKGKRGPMALKIDMEKAYDRVEWPFLFEVLRYLGFSKTWIHLINQCVSTVSHSIVLNGSPFGLFTPQRGFCQGDPISHFLFILCAASLSRLLLHAKNQGSFKGVRIS